MSRTAPLVEGSCSVCWTDRQTTGFCFQCRESACDLCLTGQDYSTRCCRCSARSYNFVLMCEECQRNWANWVEGQFNASAKKDYNSPIDVLEDYKEQIEKVARRGYRDHWDQKKRTAK